MNAKATLCGHSDVGRHPACNRLCAADDFRRRYAGYENLLLFAKLYDIPRRDREQRIHEALELMGLEDAAGPDGARADGRASFAAARSRSRRSKSWEPGRA